MKLSTQVLLVLLPLTLAGLVVVSSIALHTVRSLALPIPTATATAALLLPLVTGGALRSAQSLTRRASAGRGNAGLGASWSAVVIVMLLFIYDTVIATLALTYMAPPGDLSCRLDRRWAWLFSNKNADVIRRIQDRHQCCGFINVRDRAWPFPGAGRTVEACHEAFGRQHGCFGGWRRDEQITGGLLLLVAVVTCLLKIIMLVIYRRQAPFYSATRSDFSTFEADADAPTDRNPRLIQGNMYSDDPPAEEGDGQMDDVQVHSENNDRQNQAGLLVQPSRLHGEGNEWR